MKIPGQDCGKMTTMLGGGPGGGIPPSKICCCCGGVTPPGQKPPAAAENCRFGSRDPSGRTRFDRGFRFPAESGQTDPSRTRSCHFSPFGGSTADPCCCGGGRPPPLPAEPMLLLRGVSPLRGNFVCCCCEGGDLLIMLSKGRPPTSWFQIRCHALFRFSVVAL